MPEEKQDPASTQMFRAFVERGDPEGDRRGTLPVLLLAVAVVLIAAVAVVLLVN
jgi:flagellar basal body-associated protein FliL